MKTPLLAAAFVSLLFVSSAPAIAQVGYFGQNKVQYRDFKFQVMKTPHFDVYYYPEEEAAARMAGRMAERWYARYAALFDHQLRGRQPLVLYGSGAQFRQTNVVEEDLGEGTGGVTEALKRRIVLPFAGPIQSTDHVLGHELVHAFQYDITNTNASSMEAGNAGAMSLPLWFIEGMAEYLSLGPDDPNTAMWMREAVRREKLPNVDDLDNPKYFPYRYGEALWAYIGGKYGDRTIPTLLRASVGREGYKAAFKSVLGVTSKELSDQWHTATYNAYRPIAEATKMPADFSRPLLVNTNDHGGYNISPELSPDGSKIIFFSSRDLFSIDLYIADAATGKVLHKITNTATNAHFDSIEFIESAGAWSHDGRKFAFPGLSHGEAILTIVNVDQGDTEREVNLKGHNLDEVQNPTWSPDGRQIAFSALTGGFTDLFVYDLESGALRRLTNDSFAELHPAWSPDGKTIAFSTDRFTTNVAGIMPGPLRLAAIDVASGAVRELGGNADAKNINPQWAPDGRSLYFISDRQGISNIYRMDVTSGSIEQVTNVLTGVSGITDLSPALSIGSSRLAYSVYENNGFDIYAIDQHERVALVSEPIALPRNAGILPPRTAPEGIVASYLSNDTTGLPAPSASFPSQPYKPKLQLDYFGQPVVGVGVDSFGTYVGGGMSALFSDVLGDHTLGVSGQITSRFDEAGGSIFFLNRTHRWNWGAVVDQTPYVYRTFAEGIDTSTGSPLIVDQEFRTIQTDRGVSGIALYPFSRDDRIEVTGGLRQITGKADVTTYTYDYYSGAQLAQDTTRLATFPTLNLGMTSGAFVHDSSIFGVTSPIRGSRYRLEMDQTNGSITYTSALTDYRAYLMPVRPFTIALRGMYYGRFGSGAENSLLTPVFIGYPNLVRGYDYNSFDPAECGSAGNGSCPVFDRLIGSRMLVANAELRFPPWGAFGGSNFYGPLPLELALFADAGAAWTRERALRFTGPGNDLARSVGIAARVNVLGFAVAEIDYVHPLDRPLKGWLWQFNFSPGF